MSGFTSGETWTTGESVTASKMNNQFTGGSLDLLLHGGSITPEADGTRDIGSATKEFKDLYIDGIAYLDDLSITTARTTTNCIDLIGDSLTTGLVLNVTADALTTGGILYLDSDSANTGTRSLVNIINNNTAATGTTLLTLNQDSTGTTMYLDNGGTGKGLHVYQSGVLGSGGYGIFVESPVGTAQTGVGSLVHIDMVNTTSTANSFYIRNLGAGTGIAVVHETTAYASGKHGLSIATDVAHTVADTALAKLAQSSATATEPALEIDNNGLGAALEIDSDGSHGSTKVVGALIDVDNADTGDQIALDIDMVDETKSYFARFNATTAWTSAKDPETHAEAGWVKIMVGSTAYFIPYYAAS